MWLGHTMAVSVGSAALGSRGGLAASEAPFSRGLAGRVGQGCCGPRGPGRAGAARWRAARPAALALSVSEAARRTQAASPPCPGRGGWRASPSASRLPARPRLGRRPRVRWQEDGAGRVPGTGDRRPETRALLGLPGKVLPECCLRGRSRVQTSPALG